MARVRTLPKPIQTQEEAQTDKLFCGDAHCARIGTCAPWIKFNKDESTRASKLRLWNDLLQDKTQKELHTKIKIWISELEAQQARAVENMQNEKQIRRCEKA